MKTKNLLDLLFVVLTGFLLGFSILCGFWTILEKDYNLLGWIITTIIVIIAFLEQIRKVHSLVEELEVTRATLEYFSGIIVAYKSNIEKKGLDRGNLSWTQICKQGLRNVNKNTKKNKNVKSRKTSKTVWC